MKTNINRTTFEVCFKDAMGADKYVDEYGEVITITPCLVIRNYTTEYDHEFTNEAEAWNYFKNLHEDRLRVMNAVGSIYFDYF